MSFTRTDRDAVHGNFRDHCPFLASRVVAPLQVHDNFSDLVSSDQEYEFQDGRLVCGQSSVNSLWESV